MRKYFALFTFCFGFMTTVSASCPTTNFYVKGSGGPNWQHKSEFTDVTTKYKTGYIGSLALGYDFQTKSVSWVELEVVGRINSLDRMNNARNFVFDIKGTSKSLSGFINAFYVFKN